MSQAIEHFFDPAMYGPVEAVGIICIDPRDNDELQLPNRVQTAGGAGVGFTHDSQIYYAAEHGITRTFADALHEESLVWPVGTLLTHSGICKFAASQLQIVQEQAAPTDQSADNLNRLSAVYSLINDTPSNRRRIQDGAKRQLDALLHTELTDDDGEGFVETVTNLNDTPKLQKLQMVGPGEPAVYILNHSSSVLRRQLLHRGKTDLAHGYHDSVGLVLDAIYSNRNFSQDEKYGRALATLSRAAVVKKLLADDHSLVTINVQPAAVTGGLQIKVAA